MDKYEIGFLKKSFSLYFHDAEIWCEHLDALQDKKELVIQKFKEDLTAISKPSTSSFIIVNLDDTIVDDEIVEMIISSLVSIPKLITKVVFVGLNKKYQKYIKKYQKRVKFLIKCLDDYELAKESFFHK